MNILRQDLLRKAVWHFFAQTVIVFLSVCFLRPLDEFLMSVSYDKRHAEFNSNKICRCGKRLILI